MQLAHALALDRAFHLHVLPVSLALPWGVNVGDLLGHVPLPAKITVQVLPPIDVREVLGPRPDPDEAYEHVVGVMQQALDDLAAERRFPIVGVSCMRVSHQVTIEAPVAAVWELIGDPPLYPRFLRDITQWEPVARSVVPRRRRPSPGVRRREHLSLGSRGRARATSWRRRGSGRRSRGRSLRPAAQGLRRRGRQRPGVRRGAKAAGAYETRSVQGSSRDRVRLRAASHRVGKADEGRAWQAAPVVISARGCRAGFYGCGRRRSTDGAGARLA
jgi:hypothetical protein